MAETEHTTATTPAIAYEYVWFGGQPVAQFDAATNTPHWTFTDHLGTRILQTNASGAVDWRAEYEPHGTVNTLRAGATRHQPLRFPGQEYDEASADRSYNIFRWYRGGWGRYTQPDPESFHGKNPLRDRHRARYERAADGNRWTVISGKPLRPEDLSGGTEVYAYASGSPIMFKDPLGLKPCLVSKINPVSAYVPAEPPGKTFRGCQYIGNCGGYISVYEVDAPLGCPCKDFCVVNTDYATGTPVGPSICFNMPPLWTLVPSPPILGPF
jgi:RHS repeat-associated protein